MSTEQGNNLAGDEIRLTRRPRPEIRLTRRAPVPIRLTPRVHREPEGDSEIRITGFWGTEDPLVVEGLRRTLQILNEDGAGTALEIVEPEPGQDPSDVRYHVTGTDTLDVPITYLVGMERKAIAMPNPGTTE